MLTEKTKRRNSCIELLRIVAVLAIVLMHAVRYGTGSSDIATRIGIVAVNSVGNMGVTIFILISGYFGIRFRPSKLIKLWAMMFVYSVAVFTFKTTTGMLLFTAADLYEALTPVTSNTWWFMTCYFILFCMAPFLNRIVVTLTQRGMLTLLGILSFFLILSPTFLLHSVTVDAYGKGLPNFLLTYLIGQYIGRYGADKLDRHGFSIFTTCAMTVFAVCAAATVLTGKTRLFLCHDNNLLIVGGAIGLFLSARSKQFSSKVVNYAAGFVFPLFLANLSILDVLHPQYTDTAQFFSWRLCLLTMLETVVVAVIIEIARRLIFDRVVDNIGRKVEKRFWH